MSGDVARSTREQVTLQLDTIAAALATLDQIDSLARPEQEALGRAVRAMREQLAGVRRVLEAEAS